MRLQCLSVSNPERHLPICWVLLPTMRMDVDDHVGYTDSDAAAFSFVRYVVPIYAYASRYA